MFAAFYSKYEADDANELKAFIGVTRNQFDALIAAVGERLQCKKRHLRPIPVDVRLAIFLRHKALAQQSMKRVAREFGLGHSTVQAVLKQVGEALSVYATPTAAELPQEEQPMEGLVQHWSKTWTDREREILIEEVGGRPHLYDHNDRLYKSKEERAAAFEEIGAIISRKMNYAKPIEARYVAAQWKILKDTFNRTRRSVDGRPNEQPTWRFFSKLSFLAPEQTPLDVKPDGGDLLDGAFDSNEWAQTSCEFADLLPTSPVNSTESPNSVETPASEPADFNLEEFIVNVVQRRLLDAVKPDEFDLFGRLVGNTLRDLHAANRQLAEEMRAEVGAIVLKYGAQAIEQ
ncbi:MADF domain-containing protein [Aphelenchoides fujianensis]|nr:MADF domain-containing protein [Aphelenchoides fujianensis]